MRSTFFPNSFSKSLISFIEITVFESMSSGLSFLLIWFSNEKTMKIIFIAAAVLAATGFAFCARGTSKRKNKGRKTKKRKFK